MPLYSHECPVCGAKEDIILSLSELDDMIFCKICDQQMYRVCGNGGGFRLGGGNVGWASTGYATTYGDACAFEEK